MKWKFTQKFYKNETELHLKQLVIDYGIQPTSTDILSVPIVCEYDDAVERLSEALQNKGYSKYCSPQKIIISV